MCSFPTREPNNASIQPSITRTIRRKDQELLMAVDYSGWTVQFSGQIKRQKMMWSYVSNTYEEKNKNFEKDTIWMQYYLTMYYINAQNIQKIFESKKPIFHKEYVSVQKSIGLSNCWYIRYFIST